MTTLRNEAQAATRPSFAICGLGNVGRGIASRLAAAGNTVAFDVDAEHLASAATTYGVKPVANASELASAPIIVLSLPNPNTSVRVLRELVPGLSPDHVVIEASTVNGDDIAAEYDRISSTGAQLIDSAVIGGVKAVYDGNATLLVGGDDAVVEAAGPALNAIGPHQLRLGPRGSGMAAKVINNAVSHAVMVVLSEAFSLGAATGVAPNVLVELLQRPDAGLMRPLTYRIAERVLKGDFDGGMPLQAARKDSTLALDLGRDTGVPLFAIQAAHTVYEIGMGMGLERKDYASIATLWEAWTKRPLGTPENPSNS